MSLGLLLLFGHITVMISAIMVSFGPALMFQVAQNMGNVAMLRALATPTWIGVSIPILYVVGGLLGLAAAINFGTNLLVPWLVIAYALWVFAMLTGVAVHRPYFIKANTVLQAAPDGRMSPEVVALLADPRERWASIADYAIIVAILFDMVVKPFS
jgi:hypothetical protein